MNLRARSLALALCLPAAAAAPVLLTPSVAHAQDDPMIKMARERFQEGVKFYDQKKYEDARAAFLQAYALKKHPAVLLNLAQSEVHSGHDADAAKHFSQFLRENTGATPQEKKDAEGGLIIAKSRTEEVTLDVDQPGAEVFVDGQSEGFAPLAGPIFLMPGSHTIEARKGGKTASQTVNAAAAVAATVKLSFSGNSAPPAVAPVPTGGGAETPPAAPEQPPPPAASEPQPPPDQGAAGSVTMDTGGEREPFFKWAAHNKLAWVGGGLAVVGLGGGIGFAIGSHTNYNNANTVAAQILAHAASDPSHPNTNGLCNHPPSAYVKACNTYSDDRNSGDTQKTLSTVSFVIAGAAVAGTVVYYFVDSKPKKTAARSVDHGLRAGLVPIAGPGVQGIDLVGEF